MEAKSILWKIAGEPVELALHGIVMGILNVTPDSFSDRGQFFVAETAVEHGLQMAAEGARIIDVGGESTRPGAHPVLAEIERKRVVPVIEMLRGKTDAFLSVDTSKASVAEAALEAGASMVNDVSGGRADPEMMPLVARFRAAFVIMHMQGTPETMQRAPHYDDVVTEVGDFFRQQYQRAVACGIDPSAIAFDPGIGFGKTLEHNLELLRNLPRLRVEDRPIVLGVSRKAFLGNIGMSDNFVDRVDATVAATAALRARGAEVFRVHDVKQNVAALRVAESLRAP